MNAVWYPGVTNTCIFYTCICTCMIAAQDGQTALYIASKKGFGVIVELLLEKEHTDVSLGMKVRMTRIPLSVLSLALYSTSKKVYLVQLCSWYIRGLFLVFSSLLCSVVGSAQCGMVC